MDKPERKYVVVIRLEANTWERMKADVQEVADLLAKQMPPIDSTSIGGYSTYRVIAVEHPDMTHEKYFSRMDEWLDERGRAIHESRGG